VFEADGDVPHEDRRLEVLGLVGFGLWRKEDCGVWLRVLLELFELAALLLGEECGERLGGSLLLAPLLEEGG
jgi:hypothetical protein